MIVLGIDGALGAFSVSLASNGAVVASDSKDGAVALEAGLAMVADILARAEFAPPAIDRIAVGCGPGTFTGLRIAVAYAKSLAQAWRRPLVAIDSFDVLEYGRNFERVLTVIVGRPGVISARYRNAARIRRASGRIAEVVAAVLENGATALPIVGARKDVLAALAERGTVVQPFDPLVRPAAAAVALAAFERTPASSIHEVRADYGELPAARSPKLAK
ncbi:MAG: tRNA (adenosine(37)-N6)-threonylcarbamoyltransferase complex dimerization subunit type 1 TsaB [Candidatus Eremiobacteraeota bacterium]|nr:tRNA (adenosine(37)-N6)-threonylcarbamoyltransferase complex dimerization subunit type 1 TsaB [Candidatus Eremiobacteraeota bacterium]